MSDQKSIRQQDEEIERKRQEEKLQIKLELESNKQQQQQIKQQLKEFEKKHIDEKEEFERQQQETEEEKRERIEREVRKLEEKFNLSHLPQRQQRQAKKISELTLEQHDQLLLYKISTDGDLEDKFCTELPIGDVIDKMESFIPQKHMMNIKEIEMSKGSFTASKRLLVLGTLKKLKIGWSRQLLQALTSLDKKHKEELISPNHVDLEEFNKRADNSLLDQLMDKQRTHCGTLISPMGRVDSDSEDVPVVHPELCVSKDHFRTNSAFTDGTYKPSEEGRKPYKDAPRISFNDVTKSTTVETPESAFSALLRKHHRLSLFFIGPAGCGKTTITKRMAKTWIEDHKMAFLIPFVRTGENDRWSLKNLLTSFGRQLHGLENPSEEEIDEAFQWILDNQDKCLIVLDGLDQSTFVISNQPIEDPDINDEFLPGDLVSLLMSRRFLPNCRLVVTSRPQSLTQLAPVIQPNIVVFVNDLLSDDVEKLMNYYLQQHGPASRIMEKLRMKKPGIYQLLSTPMFLRLVVMLINEVGEYVWTYTSAKLFF